jgi:hypothetical protein
MQRLKHIHLPKPALAIISLMPIIKKMLLFQNHIIRKSITEEMMEIRAMSF